MTKDAVTEQILSVLKDSSGMVNPSVITQKLRWNKDIIAEVCELFDVQKFTEVLAKIPGIKMSKNESGTAYVQFVQNSESKTQKNAKTEENNMAENNTKTEKLHDRIERLRDALSSGLYEKDEAIRLVILTAIAGESIFFLGAPGCAKSMIARRVVQAFKAGGDNAVKYFETLLNQFSTPEEVFGNISLKALNGELEGQDGKEEYRRLTENMLPEADIAFLDEIWKASPAILNTLLTIINERKFHNGSKVENVPLKALFAASNELPAKDRGLEALYDRFILRFCVGYIENEDNFFDMIDGESSSEFALPDDVKDLQITNDELKDWKGKIDVVTLSEEAKAVISAIRKELTARNEAMSDEDKKNGELWEVGDRRWKKIAHILKASAFLNDRTAVDLMDCQLIEYCIWSTEKQQTQARDIVEKCIKQNGLDCDTAIEEINEQIEEFDEYITSQFYIQSNGPKIYKMKDGHKAYKIVTPKRINSYNPITPTYLCEEYEHQDYNRKGAYYDDNEDFIGDYDYYFEEGSFEISGSSASRTDGHTEQKYSFEIEMKPDEFIKDPKVFKTSDLLELRQNKADSEKYTVIKNHITSEIQKLDDFATKQSAPYKANLFADQYCCDVIMSAVNDAKEALQDAQVDLDKKRNYYLSDSMEDSKVNQRTRKNSSSGNIGIGLRLIGRRW